jgi:hypothetical protein
MSQLDNAIERYRDLMYELNEHQQKEPIGSSYTKEDTFYWSKLFYEINADFQDASTFLKKLLDDELDHYMNQGKTLPTLDHWNKGMASLFLKQRLGLHFSAPIKELFLYVGQSVMCIPGQYKAMVINGFAHSLDEWASIDIDVLRDAVKNIGFSMEERCYHCNELMPDFQGSGHAVCTDCA